MVYCNSCNIAVDIYLQSGTGSDTKSAYGEIHTVSRAFWVFVMDGEIIKKRLPKMFEFQSYSIGSGDGSEAYIEGARDWTTVGGHVGITGRRMISFIGCEECYGYIFQMSDCIGGLGPDTFSYVGGRPFFGLQNDIPYTAAVGCSWQQYSAYPTYPGPYACNGIGTVSPGGEISYGNRFVSNLTPPGAG